MIFSADFIKGMGERAVKTFCQVLLAGMTVGSAIWDIDWKTALGLALTALVASVLTSVGNASFTSGNSVADDTTAITNAMIDEEVSPRHGTDN